MENFAKTLLYVDDELINVELFKTIFSRLYNVKVASSAIEGLELIKNQQFDLIITDEKMPGMSGMEFLKQINLKFPYTPPYRILTSAYSKPSSIDEAFNDYNLYKFVEKPWKVSEFRTIVKEVLGDL